MNQTTPCFLESSDNQHRFVHSNIGYWNSHSEFPNFVIFEFPTPHPSIHSYAANLCQGRNECSSLCST